MVLRKVTTRSAFNGEIPGSISENTSKCEAKVSLSRKLGGDDHVLDEVV